MNPNKYNSPRESGPGSNSNEGVLDITQWSRTGALISDGLVLYPGHTGMGSHPSARNTVGLFFSRSQQDGGSIKTIQTTALLKSAMVQSAVAVEYIDCISADSPNECLGFDAKQFDGEAPVMLELLRMQSTHLLSSLPGPIYESNRTKLCTYAKLNSLK